MYYRTGSGTSNDNRRAEASGDRTCRRSRARIPSAASVAPVDSMRVPGGYVGGIERQGEAPLGLLARFADCWTAGPGARRSGVERAGRPLERRAERALPPG